MINTSNFTLTQLQLYNFARLLIDCHVETNGRTVPTELFKESAMEGTLYKNEYEFFKDFKALCDMQYLWQDEDLLIWLTDSNGHIISEPTRTDLARIPIVMVWVEATIYDDLPSKTSRPLKVEFKEMWEPDVLKYEAGLRDMVVGKEILTFELTIHRLENYKGLPIRVLKSRELGDCSANGVTSRREKMILAGLGAGSEVFEPETWDEVMLVDHVIVGEPHYFIKPFVLKHTHSMAGGAFGWTSDSRFPKEYPLEFHDRVETSK